MRISMKRLFPLVFCALAAWGCGPGKKSTVEDLRELVSHVTGKALTDEEWAEAESEYAGIKEDIKELNEDDAFSEADMQEIHILEGTFLGARLKHEAGKLKRKADAE